MAPSEQCRHGPGVAPEDASRVFDRFCARPNARSLLARARLSIVKDVAESHGGSVTLEQASGGGARFRLRLATSASPRSDKALASIGWRVLGWLSVDGKKLSSRACYAVRVRVSTVILGDIRELGMDPTRSASPHGPRSTARR